MVAARSASVAVAAAPGPATAADTVITAAVARAADSGINIPLLRISMPGTY